MKASQLALVPIILIAALAIALYLNQPKTIPSGGVQYVGTDSGDEYLAIDYTSPEEAGIGGPEKPLTEGGLVSDIGECEGLPEINREWCYSEYATVSGDVKGCEAIQGDVAIKDDCFAQLAVQKKDSGLCGEIKTNSSECYTTVAIDTNSAALCENGKADREQCFKAAEAKSYEACPLSDARRICNNAVSQGNPSLCNEVKTYDEYCYLNVAINTNNSSLCNKAGPSVEHCFFKVATTLNNAAICENLAETRDNCVAWVAFNTNNKQLCYQAGAEVQSCLEDLS